MLTDLRRYEILREIGSGGMGTVYEALDRELGQHVALKTVQTLDASALLRFKNEFRALQDLSHPNLITLGELVEEGGQWFFTMELIEGSSFIDYVRREPRMPSPTGDLAAAPTASLAPTLDAGGEPPLPPSPLQDRGGPSPTDAPKRPLPSCDHERLRHALRQLSEGLTALHDAGLVHRDVKPSNVLVTDDGRVVILDFGLVTSADTDEDSLAGTLDYMSPEQLLGHPVGPHSDWYAVGVMVFEALTGTYPFHGDMKTIMYVKATQDAPAIPEDAAPAPLPALCRGLLERDPERRTRGAGVLVRLGSSAAPLLPEIFVGREEEQSALEAAFEASLARSRPTVVQVVGEAGIGKSTLVRAVVEALQAATPTLRILWSRCYERERLHYKALDGIVDGAARLIRAHPDVFELGLEGADLALLGRLFPVLEGHWIPRSGPPSDSSPRDAELRLEAASALGTLLTRLADLTPLLLVVEDLHWSDPDGIQLLSDTLRETGVGLLLVTISHDPLAIWDPTGLEHDTIPLQPLSSAELMRLVERTANETVEEALAGHILSESRGNPLFATQMMRAREHLDVGPATFDDHVSASVAGLPRDARVLLEWLAVGGMALPESLIHRTVKHAGIDYTAGIAQLRIGRFSRTSPVGSQLRLETYHDRIRSVVMRGMPPSLKRRRAQELAEAGEELADVRGIAALMANLYREADKPLQLAAHALEAAYQADRALAFEQAAEWYRTALEHGAHGGEERRDVLGALASVLSRSGHGRDAALAFEEAARLATGPQRIVFERRAAESWMVSGHLDHGLDALARIFGQLGEHIPLQRGPMLARYLVERLRLKVTRFQPRSPTSRHELGHRIDLLYTIAGACLSVDPVLSGLCHTRALRYALTAGDRFRAARQLHLESLMTAYRDGTPRHARTLQEQARRLTPIDDADALRATRVAAEGAVLYFSARSSDAEAALEEAEHLILEEQPVPWWQLNNVRFARLSLVRFHGHFDALEEYFRKLSRESLRRGDLYASTTYTRNGLVFWLAKDRLDLARRDHASVTWAPSNVGFHFQHYLEWLAETELGLYERHLDLASCERGYRRFQRSLFAQSVRMTRCEARFTWGRVAAHAAMTARGSAERLRWVWTLRRAAARLERERLPYTEVWSRVLRACEASLARPRALRAQLRRLAESAVEHDMPLYGLIARHRLTPSAELETHGIVNLDRFAHCFMPLSVTEHA